MNQNQINKTPGNTLWSLDMKLYIADGEPYVFNDTLYLYGSRDVPGGMVNGQVDWCSEDYHVVCSKDLVNWKDCGKSYSLDEIPGKDDMGDRPLRLWAPDACYNPKDQKYYLFSCLNGGRGFFVASSDSPEGPFTNTKRLTIDHEDVFPACIDPGVLMDDDGKAYIAWPAADGKPWGIAQLDPDDLSNILGDTVTEVTGMTWPFEGPSLRKRGDTYYYIYIQNDGPMQEGNIGPMRMAYMTSKHPLGPYKDQGLIIESGDYPESINIHGSIVEWQGQWYVFYHLPLQGFDKTRVACAAPLEFNSDDTIIEAKLHSCGARPAFSIGECIPAYTAVIFSKAKGKRPEVYKNQQEQRCDFSNKDDRHLFYDRVGQYAGWRYVDFGDTGSEAISITVHCETACELELRADEHDGQLLARIDIAGSEDYQTCKAACLSKISQRHAVFLKLTRKAGTERLRVQSLEF